MLERYARGSGIPTASRKHKNSGPRDNTIFELGLFLGALNRQRTLIVTEKGLDVKIPTDLLGVALSTSPPRKGKPSASDLLNVCDDLRETVKELGPK